MRSFYNTYIRGKSVNQLIAVNALVFVLVNVIQAISSLSIVRQLAAPAAWNELILKPWTLLTHMFTHENVGHLFFNMLVLFFMGQFFLQLQNAKRLIILYFGAGLMGYLLFSLAFGFGEEGSQFHSVIGASAAAMGLVVTNAVLRPMQPIHLFGVFKMYLWICLVSKRGSTVVVMSAI
jgi:membrane associated rhomboid family serine protease